MKSDYFQPPAQAIESKVESPSRSLAVLLSLAIALLLMLKFGGYVAMSGDMTEHFMLVNEIMNHDGVRPGSEPLLSAMYSYPPASHWMAAVIGWICGSGLVGIAIVTILSVYLSYLLIGRLVGEGSSVAIAIYAALFCALIWTNSQIGWEVVVNYFYPQLVGDVAYLAALLWLAKNSGLFRQAAFIVLAGIATMWIQPLNALHILGTGILVLLFGLAQNWRNGTRTILRDGVAVAAVIILSLLAVKFHPSFRSISINANHDGYLEFGYPHLLLVAALCAAIGLFNLWRCFTGRTGRYDAVLGAAVVAAVGLVYLQFIALKLFGIGSNYAVKKHMFIVITMAMMNAARIAAVYVGWRYSGNLGRLAIPVGAGLASAFILQSLNTPVVPILEALDYASHVAKYDLPGFVPGNTVDNDSTQPRLINFMISTTAFQHQLNGQANSWLFGADPLLGSKYAMVRRTKEVDENCNTRFGESADYVMVSPDCLRLYSPGETLDFRTSGNGSLFLGDGWSVPEKSGIWSNGSAGSQVNLILSTEAKGPLELIVDGQAFISDRHPQQTFDVEVNGTSIAQWTFNLPAGEQKRSAVIPAQNGSRLNIVFKPLDSVSPSKLDPTSPDTRILGLYLTTLIVKPVS